MSNNNFSLEIDTKPKADVLLSSQEKLSLNITTPEQPTLYITSSSSGYEDLSKELNAQETLLNNQTDKLVAAIDTLKTKASGALEYTPIDYIQFTGSQFIDTGIVGNQDTQICASFTWENTTQRHLYGCASSDNKASITSYMNGSWRFGDKSTSKTLSSKEPKLPYSSLVNKTQISLANAKTNISGVSDFETVGTLLLGGARDTDGTLPTVGIVGKVFYFILWDGDTKVRHFVPAINANGEYGFWDKVTNTFFSSVTDVPLQGGNF